MYLLYSLFFFVLLMTAGMYFNDHQTTPTLALMQSNNPPPLHSFSTHSLSRPFKHTLNCPSTSLQPNPSSSKHKRIPPLTQSSLPYPQKQKRYRLYHDSYIANTPFTFQLPSNSSLLHPPPLATLHPPTIIQLPALHPPTRLLPLRRRSRPDILDL